MEIEKRVFEVEYKIDHCAICGCDINPLDSSGRGFGVMLLGYKEQGKVETYCNPCIVNKLWAYDKLVKEENKKETSNE